MDSSSNNKNNKNNKRVLSIQSHVVYGYVGNKAAVFPLQLLGFDVDSVNSVHFSCHTGYKFFPHGEIMNGDQLRTILQGLESNGLLGTEDDDHDENNNNNNNNNIMVVVCFVNCFVLFCFWERVILYISCCSFLSIFIIIIVHSFT
mmetsp:Transcript_19849/g.21943  ORF Transcript_19849/g.21943 Transcript_19849/m.21943 type:complete len:146 (-) Transcript_19849:117-554(-)